MLLGKRPRPPIMRRTRSMSGGLSVDMQIPDNQTRNLEPHHEEQQSSMMSDYHNPLQQPHSNHDDPHAVLMTGTETPAELTVTDECLVKSTVMFPSHTTTITNNIVNHNIPLSVSAHVIHSTPHFLRTCGLCNCRLAPGRDIYMYRGDTAFCSLECREEQMKQDRRKEKWKMSVSNKEDHRVSTPCAATAKASTAACT